MEYLSITTTLEMSNAVSHSDIINIQIEEVKL